MCSPILLWDVWGYWRGMVLISPTASKVHTFPLRFSKFLAQRMAVGKIALRALFEATMLLIINSFMVKVMPSMLILFLSYMAEAHHTFC